MNTRIHSTWQYRVFIILITTALFMAALATTTWARPLGSEDEPRLPDRATATITVQSAADDGTANPANCPGAGCRLRDALAYASPGDIINFGGGYTITLASTLTISKNVTLDGAGYAVSVSGNNAVRVFTISTGVNATFQNLTIRSGRTTDSGGGVYVSAGSVVTINNGTLLSNTATVAGGGLYIAANGVVNIYATTIKGNAVTGTNGNAGVGSGSAGSAGSAARGGGIAVFGGKLNLQGVTVISNTVIGGNGGAGGAGAAGSAGGAGGAGGDASGGGLYIHDTGVVTITGSTIISNSVAAGRGGVGGTGGIGSTGSTGATGSNGACDWAGLFCTNGNTGGTGGMGAAGGAGGNSGAGGQALGGGVYNLGELVMLNSVLTANRVSGGNGNSGGTGGQGGQGGKGGTGGQGGSGTECGEGGNGGQGGIGGVGGAGGAGGAGGNGQGGAIYSANTLDLSSTQLISNVDIQGGAGQTGTAGATGGSGGAGGNAGPGGYWNAWPFSGQCAGGAGGGSGSQGSSGGTGANGSVGQSEGGGLYNSLGTSNIGSGSVISGNQVDGNGGGVYNADMLWLENSTLASNSATSNGGGIYNMSTLTVDASTFISNTANAGAGLYNRTPGQLTLENSTLSGNSAGFGGGIYNESGAVTALNSTLSGNSGGEVGGGIHTQGGTLELSNTIIAHSPHGGDCSSDYSPTINADHNLFEDTIRVCGLLNGVNGNLIGVDPMLRSLGNYGGSTQTFAPLPNSPIVDAGNNLTCLAMDQRGVARPQGTACDIGAVEWRGYALTKSGDNQAAAINTAFAQPLGVTLGEAGGVGWPGMTITYTAPASGASIVPPTTVTATTDANGQTALAVTANGVAGSYVVTATASNVDPVTFALANTYLITPTTGAHGSISPGTPQLVNLGSAITFTLMPDVGYHVIDVGVDGTSHGPIGLYTFSNVTAHHTISAAFAINTYTITPTAGAHGSITPGTSQTVTHGETITFTITPDSGYSIAEVMVDGVPQGAIGTYTFSNVTASHTISASFANNLFTITPSAGAGGSLTPGTPQAVSTGNSITFTIAPDTGYHVIDVGVDGVPHGPLGLYTFSNVTAPHTISASFAINTYTITPTAGAHGSISPGTPQTANYGDDLTFTITPDTGYHIVAVAVDGSSHGPIGSYTFNGIAAHHTISASFAINTYTITPTAGAHGSISPGTPQTVNHGETITFTIAADANYHLVEVVVDGVPQGAIDSYTFSNVTTNHTLNAAFAIDTHTITPAAGAHGSISPDTPQAVNHGAAITFTITPDEGYHLVEVGVDGSAQGPIGSYTFSNVTADHTISATFAINTHTLTPTAGAHGSIIPGTAQTVNYGEAITFTIASDVNYHLIDVGVDGVSQGVIDSYTFSNVTSDHTISASFAINTHIITPTAGANGAILPGAPQAVNHGEAITFTIAPDTGYHVAEVGVDGFLQGAIESYTFSTVTANHIISASFAINTYTITPTAGANGSITPGIPQTVNHGDAITFTITPDSGYAIVDVLVDGVSHGAIGSYTFSNIAANHTISASFANNLFTITPSAGAGGSINPGTPQAVTAGSSITFTIAPDAGYAIDDVGVDGMSHGAIGLYTFSNVAANHTISAAFVSTGPQTRTIGVISVMADTFTDLGNGQTRATGNIRLGHYLFLTDPAGSVIYDTTTLTATGKVTVIANGSTLNVVTGTFRAPITTGVAAPIGTPDDLITSAAGFVLTDVVVSAITIPIDQFSVNANLNVAVKDITITTGVDLYVSGASSGLIYSGTLGAFDFAVGGVTVTVAPSMTLSNTGIAIPAATITMPVSLGGASSTINNLTITASGLILEDGSITLPTLKWGDGSKVKLIQPIAHLSVLSETYQFSANGTLSLTLPSNNISSSLGFTLTQGGQLTGTLSNLNLTVAGSMLTMTNIAVSNSGLNVDAAVLQLPASLGSAVTTLSNVSVGADGLTLGNGTFSLPVIKIGDGQKISITQSLAQLAIAQEQYRFAVSGTLNLNLPSNALTTTLGFAMQNGQMTGTLSSLKLTVAGAALTMTNVLVSNAGLSVDAAVLQLPASLGSAVTTLSNVRVGADGLTLGNGTFSLPVIKIGDGQKISITQSLAQLAIAQEQYRFAVSGTLHLNLPSNVLSTTLGFAMQNGQMTGTLSSLHLTMAGSTLVMTDVVVSNAGLSVDSAVLQLPASLGGTAATIGGLTIDQSGLTLAQGTLALSDIKWGDGSKVKITHPSAQLTVLNNQYQFSANGTLSLTLPNNNISSTLGFTVTNGGQLTGTVNVLNLSLAGGTLTMTNIAVTNSGLSVSAAQLKLPSSLGGGLATVNDVTIDANGLSVSAGTFSVADINVGDGSKVKIDNPTATLSNTVEGYTFGINGTLQLRLPDNSQDIVINGNVNTSGQFTATISSIGLTLAKATLQLNRISMDNTGLSVVSGTLALPAKLGGVSGQVANVRIDANGLSIGGGAANFPIPNFKIGGTSGFGVSNALASLSLLNTGGSTSYQMTLSGTIAITLPGTSASAQGLVQVDNAGNISGRVNAFTLAVAGMNLSVNNISINADGSFAIAAATLALPGGFGGGSASVSNVVVYPGQPGSLSLGGAGIALPDVKWGDGSKVKIANASAQLTQVNNKYSFAFGGKLNLNLPGNVVTSTLAFSIRDDGQISGTVNLIKLTVAGGTLTMTNVGVSNNGLIVDAASLKMPASLGNAVVTVNGVTIDAAGLHLGGGQLTLADIKIGDGSKVKIAAPTATLGEIPGGYTFGINGTLQLRLPSNSQNIGIGGTINSNGQFTATVSAMALTFGGATLNLSNVTMNNSGLSVVSGTLNLPAKLGGASGGVNNVVINANGLSIGGGALAFPIPDFKIGGSSGFGVTGAQAGLQLTNGSVSYRLNLSGTVAVKIPGSNTSASGRVSMDDAGNMSGQVDAFTLTIAGMGLNVSNISINPDGSFTAGAAGFTTPSGFGGASAAVYNVVIRPGNPGSVTIGGGSFTLPTIKAGGFGLALSGALKPITSGYEISATGFATFPGVGGAAGCEGVGVGATIWTNAQGQTQLVLRPDETNGFALKNASFNLQCQIAIGTTGFFITGIEGEVTLGPTSTEVNVGIQIAAGKKIAGFTVLSADATATLKTNPFDLLLNGAVRVFVFQVGGASAHMTDHSFSATLWVNMIVAKGDIAFNAWSDYRGFHMNGSGSMQVGLAKGAIFNSASLPYPCCECGWREGWLGVPYWWCGNCQICWTESLTVPSADYLFNANTAFGEFEGDRWGVKGTVSLLGYNAGFFVDSQGNLTVGNVDNYQLIQPVQVNAAIAQWQAARRNGLASNAASEFNGIRFVGDNIMVPQPITTTTDVIFALQRSQSVPTLTLMTPSGVEITPNNLPANVQFTEVLTYTRDVSATTTAAQMCASSDTVQQANQTALLRFTHARSDLGAIDVLIDGVKVFANVSFGAESIEQMVDAGSHTLELVPANQPGPIVSSTPITLTDNTVHRLIAAGDVTQTLTLDVAQSVAPAAGQATIRFAHALADASNIDVVLAGDGRVLFGDVAPQSVTDGVNLDASQTYTFEVYAAGTNQLLAQLPNVTLTGRGTYSLIALGRTNGTPAAQLLLNVDTLPLSHLRLVNALAADQPIELWTQGITLFANLPFSATSAYNGFAGTSIDFQLTTADLAHTVLTNGSIALHSEADHTLVALDYVTQTQTLLLIDDNRLPAWGKARVRFVNASPNVGAVDVFVQGVLQFSNVAFKNASAYVEFNGGTITLEVRDHTTQSVLLIVPNVNVIDGYVYTLFLMGVNGGSPALQLAPIVDLATRPDVQTQYVVDQAQTGTWELKLNGNFTTTDRYLLTALGSNPAPMLNDLSATISGTTSLALNWRLSSDELGTPIGIFANPIIDDFTFTGRTLVADLTSSDPNWINGTLQTYNVDLNQLPSGTYHIWFEANDGRNTPVRQYAPQTIVVNHVAAWPLAWTAVMTVTPGFRELNVQWQPHPNADADGYVLKVSAPTMAATQVISVGNLTSARVTALDPDRPYSLTLQAIDNETGHVSTAQTVIGIPANAAIALSGSTGPINLIAGQSQNTSLLVTTSHEPYPGVVSFQTGCVRLSGTSCTSSVDGLNALFADDFITPTRMGVNESIVLSATESLPAGNYVVPIIATGSGLSRTFEITVVVNVRAFTLDVNPHTASLGIAQSLDLMVSSAGLNGATRPIGLSVKNAPLGLFWSLSNNVINPGDSVTLTITDTDLLASGLYPIEIRGDDGLATATTTITLTVSKPRFNLTATPSNLTVAAGKPMTAVFELNLLALDGWTLPITLTVDPNAMPALGTLGLRNNATTGTVSNTLVVMPGGTAYLVAVTTADTPRFLYTLSIDAQGGGRQQTLEVTLAVREFKVYLPLVMRNWVAQPRFRVYLPLIRRSGAQGVSLAWHQ